VGKLAINHSTLLKSKRERDIDVEVAMYSNPTSKRSVEHDMHLSDSVESMVSAMVFNNVVVQATPNNCAEINAIFFLLLSNIQDLRDRLASDRAKHLIAKASTLGWKFVSSLELLEGKVGHLSMVQLRNQEKAYMAHEVAMASLGKPAGVAPDGGGGGGGRGGNKNKNNKRGGGNKNNNNKKGGGKKGLNETKGGGVGKPKSGGCHRCGGGGHFVRNCTKELVPE
jgi:hypothetical protein